LRNQEITSEDEKPAINAASGAAREAEGAANSADTSLNETVRPADRSVLREQARAARNAADAARDDGAAALAKVTHTPIHIDYRGGGAGRGFAGTNPVREAWYLLIDSAATMVGFALKAVAVALPWLLLLLLGLLAFRSRTGHRVRRWWRGPDSYWDHDPALEPPAFDPARAPVD
jgi:hypothetical protein